LEYDV
jgi:hypothetical protein